MTLDTILKNKMRARSISMFWKCCSCEAAPEALPIYLCNALGAENKAISGEWRYQEFICGDTSCAICYRPETKCSNSNCGHEKCYGCPSHDGDFNTRSHNVSFAIMRGERFALTFLKDYNCRWQCTESSFPNFNVLEGPEPSFWNDDWENQEPTGQKMTRMIPLPRVVANRYLRSEERHIEDETNSQTELKDNTFADAQLPLSRRSPISSDRAIQAAKTNPRPAKTSQKILSQAPEWTDIDKSVNNSLDNPKDKIVAGIKISGSDRMQIGSNSTIAELSSQTTRSDQPRCSEVQEPAFISIVNTPSAVPVPSADLLPLSSSYQPTALVETESTIWNGQSRKKPIRAEDLSEIDASTKEGATSGEVKRPPYYMSEITGQTVDLPLQLSTARPTEIESGGKEFSSYSGSAKLRLIRPASPRVRTPIRALKLLRRMHRKHPAYNPPPTPLLDSPIPPPTPPPEHQQGQIVDQTLSQRLHRPAVIPQKRPASPAIRPAKIILRQRKL
ncbi:hypothetical protein EAF00_005113 [Botryotinia globosa]|nr:hypothetical protein EAF00_005113 [Botryotinia globosa]